MSAIPYGGGKVVICGDGGRAFCPWHMVDTDIVVVFDQMFPHHPKVADCADQVVEQIGGLIGPRRLIFRDHDGHFSEICLTDGAVSAIKDVAGKTLDEAVAAVRSYRS